MHEYLIWFSRGPDRISTNDQPRDGAGRELVHGRVMSFTPEQIVALSGMYDVLITTKAQKGWVVPSKVGNGFANG